ncbi:hypothetical protein ElyMa_003341900 [Elysia marginata]|uniref:CBM20 domain-containing protein n=1 Tax=Elysia marginata TaxID=1093978 RepID=A0AAV4JJG8_9GAST|nr:hypothetical protein ElyMa_003341900 [Elysia marginata]
MSHVTDRKLLTVRVRAEAGPVGLWDIERTDEDVPGSNRLVYRRYVTSRCGVVESRKSSPGAARDLELNTWAVRTWPSPLISRDCLGLG